MHAHVQARFTPVFSVVDRSWRHLCMGATLLAATTGCVSESRYEAVTKEMTGLRAELMTAQGELQALESQRDALKKLNLDGERILTGLRAELQHARAAYAEFKTEQSRLDALKAKARALQTEHSKHLEEIKAAKRAELKMQAVIDRYEREMGELSEIGDMLRVSEGKGSAGAEAPLVATVTPLSSEPSSLLIPTAHVDSVPNSAPAPHMGKEEAPRPPAPPIVASATPSSPALPPAVKAPAATPNPNPQPSSANEPWLVSFTDWLWSLWGWLFS